MMTLTAVFDETGTHCGTSFTCVGGYVFDQDGERGFTEKWAKVSEPLKRRGIGFSIPPTVMPAKSHSPSLYDGKANSL